MVPRNRGRLEGVEKTYTTSVGGCCKWAHSFGQEEVDMFIQISASVVESVMAESLPDSKYIG